MRSIVFVLIYHLSVMTAVGTSAKGISTGKYKRWLKLHFLRLLVLVFASGSETDDTMPKPYSIKDPNVAPCVRALRSVFSRPASGALGAAIGARAGPSFLEKVLPAAYGSSLVARLGSAAVGFGVGYTSMSFLHWLRIWMIKSLLEYRGWMYSPTSNKTKAWGMMLKMLIGPGPHKTDEFQNCLPRLPLPPLEQTCERYLLSVEPLLTPDEFAHTKSLVEELLQNEGPQLQKYLLEKKGKTRNWLADWWSAHAYLLRRDPIAINVNFFMTSTFLQSCPTQSPLARSANCIYEIHRYYQMIESKTLPPDIILGIVPLCMDGTRFMCGSTRIPGEHVDTLEITPHSKHIIVLCAGNYYIMDLVAKDGRGQEKPLTKKEIKKHLDFIQSNAKANRKVNNVAALTAEPRTLWAKHRQMLLDNPVNAATVRAIEAAMFIVVIGDNVPKDVSEQTNMTLCGQGADRWFDKSLLLETYGNSMKGGANMEHSGTDATHFAVMMEHILQFEEYGPDGELPDVPGEPVRDLHAPKLLNWDLAEMKDIIDTAYTDYSSRLSNMECIAITTDFGKKWMKSQKISPDGFLQMAIQLTFYRLHQTFTKTYEPATHRMFDQGRTENINPVSKDSVDFVFKMESPTATRQQKLDALHRSIKFQSDMRLEATAGWGCDRHMLGLSLAATEMGMDMPHVFTDKAFSLPMRLSSSQVPTTICQLGLPIDNDSVNGGFGPACEEGYGILYCPNGTDSFNFNITSWKTCPETDSARFKQAMLQAMSDMRDLLEGKDTAPVLNNINSNSRM